jgi:DNA-binding protein HU-beta
MNRNELIDALATKTGCTKACADRSIASLIEIITTTLFTELKIKAAKVPAFKAGATLKTAVNGAKK